MTVSKKELTRTDRQFDIAVGPENVRMIGVHDRVVPVPVDGIRERRGKAEVFAEGVVGSPAETMRWPKRSFHLDRMVIVVAEVREPVGGQELRVCENEVLRI